MALKKLVSDLTQGLGAYPNSNTSADTGGFNYGGSTSIFDTRTFNQRSLSYSQPLSRQDSPEPLIPQILPGVNQEPNESTIFLTDSPDGFIRGGETNAIKRAAIDSIRINRFFISGEGITFISNQKALQRSNPVIQEGGGNFNNVLEDVLNIGLGTNFTTANTNRTFNEENLIKQISEGGYTGNYYNRAGSNPSIQSEEQNKYEAIHKPGRKFDGNKFGEFNNMGGLVNGNRLISLGKKLNVGLPGNSFEIGDGDASTNSLMKQFVGFDVGEILNTFRDVKSKFNSFLENPLETFSKNLDDNIGFNPGEDVLYQYMGGPGSTYGIGDTILYRYERTSGNFDHQGHPLSISNYFNKAVYTTPKTDQFNFKNADGTFNTNVGLNFLTNTVNENLFGGNQILGENSIFRDDSSGKITSNSLLEGLGRQIFGNETLNFAKNLANTLGFEGVGSPNPQEENETIKVGSYFLGNIRSAFEDTKGGNTDNLKAYVDGRPKAAYIKHQYRHEKGRADGGEEDTYYYPGSIAKKIEKDPLQRIKKSLKPSTIISGDNRYQPTTKELIRGAKGKITSNDLGKNLSDAVSVSIKVADGETGNYTRESRINAGDPGATWNERSVGVDKLNALDIQTNVTTFDDEKYRDFVRFRFDAVQTDNPSNVDVMAFRAFLDDFGDQFSGEWNSFKYNGRGEEFFTYQGFKRSFNFNFKIAAQSRKEMKPLYRKLNYLVSNTAPDYSNNGRMRGPFVRLTIGAYMDRTPGFITSLNIKWQKDYPFEIALNNPEGGDDSEMHVLPHVLDVSCQFTPIHDFVPRKSIEESPFIIPGKNSLLNKTDERRWLTGGDSTTSSSTEKTNTNATDLQNIIINTVKSIDVAGRGEGVVEEFGDVNGDGINDYKVNRKNGGTINIAILNDIRRAVGGITALREAIKAATGIVTRIVNTDDIIKTLNKNGDI
mgnify:CR=1 FL=1